MVLQLVELLPEAEVAELEEVHLLLEPVDLVVVDVDLNIRVLSLEQLEQLILVVVEVEVIHILDLQVVLGQKREDRV